MLLVIQVLYNTSQLYKEAENHWSHMVKWHWNIFFVRVCCNLFPAIHRFCHSPCYKESEFYNIIAYHQHLTLLQRSLLSFSNNKGDSITTLFLIFSFTWINELLTLYTYCGWDNIDTLVKAICFLYLLNRYLKCISKPHLHFYGAMWLYPGNKNRAKVLY